MVKENVILCIFILCASDIYIATKLGGLNDGSLCKFILWTSDIISLIYRVFKKTFTIINFREKIDTYKYILLNF